jgi:hypothetical protein
MIEDYYCDDPDKAHGFYKEAISISEGLRNNLMLDDFKISFFENYIHLYQHMVSLCINMGEIEKIFTYIEKSKSRAPIDMLYHALTEVAPKENSNKTIDEILILKGELDLLRRKLQATYSTLSGESQRSNEEIEDETLQELQKLENIVTAGQK